MHTAHTTRSTHATPTISHKKSSLWNLQYTFSKVSIQWLSIVHIAGHWLLRMCMYDGRESLVFEMYNLLTIYLQFTYNLLTIYLQFHNLFFTTRTTHTTTTHMDCFAAPMSVQCTHTDTYKMTCCFADNVCCLLNIVCIVLLLLLLLLHNGTYKMTCCFADKLFCNAHTMSRTRCVHWTSCALYYYYYYCYYTMSRTRWQVVLLTLSVVCWTISYPLFVRWWRETGWWSRAQTVTKPSTRAAAGRIPSAWTHGHIRS